MAVCGIGLLAPLGAARTRGGSSDLELMAAQSQSPTPVVAGRSFSLSVSVFNHGPDVSSFTIHLQVPRGVVYRPAPGTCTGTTDLTCFPGHPAPLGDDGSSNIEFRAAAAGTYTFVAQLTDLGATDPNTANNQASVKITVAPGVRRLAVVGLKIAPVHPRVGGTFVVSFGIRDKTAGKNLVPKAPRCRASLGRTRAAVEGTRAICFVTTPLSVRGKVVRGVLTAKAGGLSLSGRFTVRFG